MATVPPDKPDRIDPGAPPETAPPLTEPMAPEPPEFEPVDPDFDQPDRAPEELPPD